MTKAFLCIIVPGILATISLGCNRDLDPVGDNLDNIFPVEKDRENIFFVEESRYDGVAPISSERYFLQEYTSGYELDGMNRNVMVVGQYKSPEQYDSQGNPVYNWLHEADATLYKDATYAERTDGNLRILCLKLPPVTGTTWNGNLYNSQPDQQFRVVSSDTSITLHNRTYKHCVFIEEIAKRFLDTPAFMENVYAYQVYAPGIGKIERYYLNVTRQNSIYSPESRFIHETLMLPVR